MTRHIPTERIAMDCPDAYRHWDIKNGEYEYGIREEEWLCVYETEIEGMVNEWWEKLPEEKQAAYLREYRHVLRRRIAYALETIENITEELGD